MNTKAKAERLTADTEHHLDSIVVFNKLASTSGFMLKDLAYPEGSDKRALQTPLSGFDSDLGDELLALLPHADFPDNRPEALTHDKYHWIAYEYVPALEGQFVPLEEYSSVWK